MNIYIYNIRIGFRVTGSGFVGNKGICHVVLQGSYSLSSYEAPVRSLWDRRSPTLNLLADVLERRNAENGNYCVAYRGRIGNREI